MKTIVIIVAAGKGSRFGGLDNKVFARLAGKTVLEHTLDIFEQHPKIEGIVVVHSAQDLDRMKALTAPVSKIMGLCEGGEERCHSVRNALAFIKQHYPAFEQKDLRVLVHDGARPLLAQKILEKVLNGLEVHGGVAVAIPVTDTLYLVDENQRVVDFPPRHLHYRAQTPQGFSFDSLDQAYRKLEANACPTDDCMVVRKAFPDLLIETVEGDLENIKITYEGDLEMAEMILKKRAALKA